MVFRDGFLKPSPNTIGRSMSAFLNAWLNTVRVRFTNLPSRAGPHMSPITPAAFRSRRAAGPTPADSWQEWRPAAGSIGVLRERQRRQLAGVQQSLLRRQERGAQGGDGQHVGGFPRRAA